jgi:hypothetical protein
MTSPEESKVLDDLFGSLSGLMPRDVVTLVPKDSNIGGLNKLIEDHIYGLLSQSELTTQQVALLAALLNGRKNNI